MALSRTPPRSQKALEAKYPTPSIHLSDEIVNVAIEASRKMALPTLDFIITQVPDRFLEDYDAVYYHRTREQQFGKPLKQVAAEIDETEVLADMKIAAKDVVTLLNKQGGPFFLGETRWSTVSPLPRTREAVNSHDFSSNSFLWRFLPYCHSHLVSASRHQSGGVDLARFVSVKL
jgi:hypothetical protein